MTSSDVWSRVTIRPAQHSDVTVMHQFIAELVRAENAPWSVNAQPEDLTRALFGERPVAEAVLAVDGDTAVGFALFFWTYSPVEGRPGLHLEDLFVDEKLRGAGIGELLLRHLARLAIDRGCARMEWPVLRTNDAAIRFYQRLHARELSEIVTMRLHGEDLQRLSAEPSGNATVSPVSNE